MSQACFYTGSNYKGDSECLGKGNYHNVKYEDRYTSAKIPKGLVAFAYEHPNFEGEYLKLTEDTSKFNRNDDRVSSIKILPDCHNPQFIWEPECNANRNIFPEIDTKRADYCNANRTNAVSERCMVWCGENKGKCLTLSRGIACGRYSIPESKCTDETILNLENECVKYHLIDPYTKTATSQSLAQCSEAGVKYILDQCKKYELTGVDEENNPRCTALGVETAITDQLFARTTKQLVDTLEKQAQLSQEQRDKANEKLIDLLQTSQETSQQTITSIAESQKAESDKQIDRAYALFNQVAKENKPLQIKPNYTQTYIIIGLVSLILIILLVVVIGIMPNKK